ncbi:MAG TPA: SUMF1/EgtB/PvdO family nonheme iron enzyme [bacterium]|nr:MAG: Formylglycine-generating sulfatase enzyme [bacterium ADurb.Bin270]HPW45470.1 SUMF1/EgtB/PvdO family nonheme iron enzyme [bacterium]HQH79899.1 SUMF1/EgtB/PvdO family nonheme iron enzyme [bacterium]
MGNCQEGMVFVKGGRYKGQTIPDLCVDQHEFTNADTSRVAAQTAGQYQLMSVSLSGSTVEVVDSGKDPKALWAKIAARGPDLTKGIAGYFLRAVSALPSLVSPKDFDKPNQPQVDVDGYQAKQFCEAQGKRLLTPIEWEYVASQGGAKRYSTRSGKFDSGVHYGAGATRQVCKAAGRYIEFGGKEICDMNGNVWEWTLDPSGDYYTSGGSFGISILWLLQADYRSRVNPGRSNFNIGFRCGSSAQDSK